MPSSIKQSDEKQPEPNIAFFVTWRIRAKNRNKDHMAIFENHRDAATFIVQNKKTKPDMQVYMAMRNFK